MLVKTMLIVTVYLLIALLLLQVGLHMENKTKMEITLFAVEFKTHEQCIADYNRVKAGGVAVYNLTAECNYG